MADDGKAEELQKKILALPNLPNVVQGDGRYVMSLLKSLLTETVLQVNLANGFTAEEINPEQGGYPTPKNFFLTFTRFGGTLTWNRIADESELEYYEVRTDTNVGASYGLLERTTLNSSTALPDIASGTIYLYAVSKSKEASRPSELNYSKPRPDAPTDITLTATNEGTLITFFEIPTDCIGATIYVDGVAYSSMDNIFLLKQEKATIEKIEIAYFDQFGEGERGALYIVLPDVTGLLVERNGSELDFYWDAINVYNVSYVVKVGNVADWTKGIELFTTKTNDKNRYIYPNTGEYYLMVKALDDHGNYSKNAAFYYISNEEDIHRNVILEFNQNNTLYSGNKLNVYYDPAIGGITLEREAMHGEYIMDVKLPQKYRARNWLEVNPLITTDSGTRWDDCGEVWDDLENMLWAGETGDLELVSIKQQIAYHLDNDTSMLFNAQLNQSLLTDDKESPTDAAHADDFRPSHWAYGLYITPLTKLAYSLKNITSKFYFSLCLKTTGLLNDCVIATIFDGHGTWIQIGFEGMLNQFYVRCSDGIELNLTNIADENRDWLTLAFSQGADKRKLFLHSLAKSKMVSSETEAIPLNFSSNTSTSWKSITQAWKDMQTPWKMFALTLCCYAPINTAYHKEDA